MTPRLPIAVMVSGNGSNLQAIINAIQEETLPAEIKLVISSTPDAYALTRCKTHKIPCQTINPKDFPDKTAYESAMIRAIESAGVQLICLAGFMRLLSPYFTNHFKGSMINIHPSLLPSFPGLNAIENAVNQGAKETGVTIHYVDEGCDTGPIILQESLPILKGDSIKSVTEKIHRIEHRLYPRAITMIAKK